MHQLSHDKGYQWGEMLLPHDGAAHHIEAIAGSAEEILRRNGFRVRVLNRPIHKVTTIEAARKCFGSCRFDRVACDDGLKHLENYQWTWDEQGETFRKTPKHNAASNAADAFQTFGWHRARSGEARWAQQLGADTGVMHTYSRGSRRSPQRDYSHIL